MLELCLIGFRFTVLDSLFLIRRGGVRDGWMSMFQLFHDYSWMESKLKSERLIN